MNEFGFPYENNYRKKRDQHPIPLIKEINNFHHPQISRQRFFMYNTDHRENNYEANKRGDLINESWIARKNERIRPKFFNAQIHNNIARIKDEILDGFDSYNFGVK